jgi:Na+/phosphate symporter
MSEAVGTPSSSRTASIIGLSLVALGIILLLIVFYAGYHTYQTYKLESKVQASDAATILNISAQILVNMLVKLAFLGVALAAGSILLSKGVDLLKPCPKQSK